MIKKQNYLLITAALGLGFASCKKDHDTVSPELKKEEAAPKTVNVKLSVAAAKTYSEAATAVGDTADLKDVHLFFTGNTDTTKIIFDYEVKNISSLKTTGETITGVPGNAYKVYAVANNGVVTLDGNLAAVKTLDDLAKISVLIDKQDDAVNSVNVVGQGLIVAGTQSGVATAHIDATPAAAKIEIGKIALKTTGAKIPLTGFKLQGIYINNTFSKVGAYKSSLDAANAVAYDSTNFKTAPYATTGKYLSDAINATNDATEFAATKGKVWAYYIAPVTAADSLTLPKINNNKRTSAPEVILEIKDAKVANGVFAAQAYVNITRFKDQSGNPILDFLPGYVYTIDSIEFDGSHLSNQATVSTTTDLVVTMSVRPWTKAVTKADL